MIEVSVYKEMGLNDAEFRQIVETLGRAPNITELGMYAVIVPDSPDEELAALKVGDVVPLLYDPQSPDKRNFLWVEIAKYVKLKNAPEAIVAPSPTPAA